MSTNKDKIIQFIKDETSKCIQNNSYTFEKCNNDLGYQVFGSNDRNQE